MYWRFTKGLYNPREPVVCLDEKPVVLHRDLRATAAAVDFWLSAERDAAAAKRFFQRALHAPGHPRPRVINVDGNPSYPKVVAELKKNGELGRRCRCRPVRYLNNIVEQDHR